MTPKEFIIQKFESNHPELVEIVKEWTGVSIKNNLDDVKILIGLFNLKCPPDEWDDSINKNKRWWFLQQTAKKIQEYLLANGYPAVGISGGYNDTLLHSNGKYYAGTLITAYTKIPADIKKRNPSQ